MYLGKHDTIIRRIKGSHKKFYRSRIKATRGLGCLGQPDTKPLSHRIVRRKLQREMITELGEE